MDLTCCYCYKPLLPNEERVYGLHRACFKKSFNLENNHEFLDLVARSQSQTPYDKKMLNISFFNGAYRKYSARLGDINYILKVQQKEYPELPATEFLCNQIFESLGIQVPDYHLIRFPNEDFCFATKNFMTSKSPADLVHIYHFVKDKENHGCENLIRIIGLETGRKIEQEKFVYLTLADSLIGNHDRHGRNLAFIRSQKGMQLAPFYDNPSALALEDDFMLGADLQPRGSIFTQKSDKPTMTDYIIEWNRLGYAYMVDKFKEALQFERIAYFIETSYLSHKRKQALLRLIKSRMEQLWST